MGQRKRKKSKRRSSSSETEEDEEVIAASATNHYGDDSMYSDLKHSLDCLREVASEGFVKLYTDLDKLRFEFKMK